VSAVVREELEKIKDVLTAWQQTTLAELKDERRKHTRERMAARTAHFKDLNLTPEQKNKIDEIRKEFRPRIHEAGNRMRDRGQGGVGADFGRHQGMTRQKLMAAHIIVARSIS
jgi:Spy/CpxP family protein refolding chaperone